MFSCRVHVSCPLRITRTSDGDVRCAQTDAAGGEEEELSNLTLAEERERDSGARDGERAVPNFTKRGRISRLCGRLCRGHPWGRTRARLRFVLSGKLRGGIVKHTKKKKNNGSCTPILVKARRKGR